MKISLDEKDEKILSILQQHGDWPSRKIAKKTLIPTTTVHNRVRKLVELGVVKRFTVEVDHEKVGKGFVVYLLIAADLLTLKQKHRTQYDILRELKRFEFVERADIVSGGTDIVAVIRASDVAEYDKALLTKIQLIDGIKSTQSLIVLH
jgi:DNA-binding Lrp family transcriptional regulator